MDIRLTNEYKIQISDDGQVKLFKQGEQIAETYDMLAIKASALQAAVLEYQRTTQRNTMAEKLQGPGAFPRSKKIKVNKARCRKCGDTIESTHRHDFVQCRCEAIAVDGGKSYIRRVGEAADIEELTEYLE